MVFCGWQLMVSIPQSHRFTRHLWSLRHWPNKNLPGVLYSARRFQILPESAPAKKEGKVCCRDARDCKTSFNPCLLVMPWNLRYNLYPTDKSRFCLGVPEVRHDWYPPDISPLFWFQDHLAAGTLTAWYPMVKQLTGPRGRTYGNWELQGTHGSLRQIHTHTPTMYIYIYICITMWCFGTILYNYVIQTIMVHIYTMWCFFFNTRWATALAPGNGQSFTVSYETPWVGGRSPFRPPFLLFNPLYTLFWGSHAIA